MEHFWRRRLPGILIPALIANAFAVTIRGTETGFNEISFIDLVNINDWVKVLLLYYIAFWIIYHVVPKLIGGGVLAGYCYVLIRLDV